MLRILLIEDQRDIAANIWDYLEHRGFVMDHAADGAKGLLKTGDGKSVDLGQIGSIKESATKKACKSVLDHAKSFL